MGTHGKALLGQVYGELGGGDRLKKEMPKASVMEKAEKTLGWGQV